MPLPSTWTKINLVWTGINLDGTVPNGTIEVHSSAPRFYVATPTPTLVLGEKPIIKSVVGGSCTIAVPATDDPDVVPNGFTYRIVEKITGRPDKEYWIEVPLAEAPSIELATIAPVAESLGQPVTLVTYAALEAISADVDDALADVAAFDTRLDTAESDINTLETDINAVESGLSTTNGAVSALDTRLDTAEADIVDHEDRIVDLESVTGEVTLGGAETLTNKTLGATKLTPDGGGQFTNLAGRRILGIDGNAAASGNNLRVTAPGTGISPSILAEGADTNIDIDIAPKGTGIVMVDGVQAADVSSAQALTNKTLVSPTTVDGVDILGVWQTYSPALTALTTNPTLGNSTLAGRWMRIGQTVHFTIALTIGSTFSAGSGVYIFSLPMEAVTAPETGIGTAVSIAGVNRRLYIADKVSTTTIMLFRTTNESALDNTGAGVAWATGHTVGISGTYEADVESD